jgi:hypothetical protein
MRTLRYQLLLACLLLIGCTQSIPQSIPQSNASSEPQTDRFAEACLVDITKALGIQFQHDVGPLENYAMPQIMGSGACFLDFDSDGDLDVLLISGVRREVAGVPTGNRLFRQDAADRFTDVTESSGLEDQGFGMGCAVGDVDNDGDIDLYLTRYGDDSLYVNLGDGKFQNVTQAAGIDNPQWATGASFFDYDRDGWLDLFVANYVDFFPGSICEDGAGRRDFCGPESLSGTVSKLYRNISFRSGGQGPQFEDVTIASGIARRVGKGLGVLCRDFDLDGRMDIFVANDGEENFLWIQHDNLVFSNEAILRGVALNRFGEAEANMGIVSDDFNRDGFSDLFITHLREESNTLFRGAQFGQFTDQTVASGFSVTSLPFTGFGVAAVDFDHDADIDLAIANGGVKRGPTVGAAGTSNPGDADAFWKDYAQRNELYLNDGRGGFESQAHLGGSDFAQRVEVSRAVISGDIDNDGDIDLLVTNCDGPARIYRNEFPKSGSWLSVLAHDPQLNRTAIGAQIQVVAGQQVINRELNPSSGYLGANDLRVHYGLGAASRYDVIRVYWPSGSGDIEEFPGGPANQQVKLVRGTGRIRTGETP